MAIVKLKRRQDAENAVSETLAAAWKHFTSGGELTLPWMYTTLNNKMLHERRRRGREARRVERASRQWVDSYVDGISDDDRLVRAAVASLEPEDAEVLWLAYFEGFSMREVAEIVGCTEPAARKRAQRARATLRTRLIEVGLGPEGEEVAQ